MRSVHAYISTPSLFNFSTLLIFTKLCWRGHSLQQKALLQSTAILERAVDDAWMNHPWNTGCVSQTNWQGSHWLRWLEQDVHVNYVRWRSDWSFQTWITSAHFLTRANVMQNNHNSCRLRYALLGRGGERKGKCGWGKRKTSISTNSLEHTKQLAHKLDYNHLSPFYKNGMQKRQQPKIKNPTLSLQLSMWVGQEVIIH